MTSSADECPRLRVCIIAKSTPFIWVHHYVKAFRTQCDLVTVGSALTRADLEASGRVHLAHLVAPNDVTRDVDSIDTLVEALPQGWAPDLVVSIQSGAPQIDRIEWLNRPTAHISVDTWHAFAELIHARPYDFVFAAQREFADHFASTGCAHAHWLPLACDPEVHRPVPCRKDYDLAFVGSTERMLHAQRVARLDRLAQRFSVLVDTALDGDAMASAYSRARIAFNSSIAQDVNMRVFEAMAMGMPLLTNRDADVNGLLDLFHDGEHLAAYDDSTLMDSAERLLQDTAARDTMGNAARREVLARHTYAHRVSQILNTISKKVDWESVRERPLLRGHGSLLDYLPMAPGEVADLGMNATTTKYALRRAGAKQLTGIAESAEETVRRGKSYDQTLMIQEAEATQKRYDTLMTVTSRAHPLTVGRLLRARQFLRTGGTLVAGLSQNDVKRLSPNSAADEAWNAVERLGYVVTRMELREPKNGDDVYAFVVARKRDRTLKEVAREVYSRNPIPGITLEETLARIP